MPTSASAVRLVAATSVTALVVGATAVTVHGAAGRGPKLLTPVTKAYKEKVAARGDDDSVYEVSRGGNVTFQVDGAGSSRVFLVVAKAKDRDRLENVTSDSIRRLPFVREMQSRGGGRYAYKVTGSSYKAYEDFWLNNPGTYAWNAVRVDCDAAGGTTDCNLEGTPRTFPVVEGPAE